MDRKQTREEKQAERILGWRAETKIYALEELAKAIPSCVLSSSATHHAILTIGTAVCDAFNDAAKINGQHPAVAFLRKGQEAINAACDLCAFWEENETSAHSHLSADEKKVRKVIGSAVLGFLRDAARWAERAQLAFGVHTVNGWLHSYYVEGMEGYTPYANPISSRLASMVDQLGQDARNAVALYALTHFRKAMGDGLADRYMEGLKKDCGYLN